MPAPYTGGCQCGSVRYVLAAEPVRAVACHCKECQRQSGSAFGMSMIVPEKSLTVTGSTKRFTRIADNGNQNTGVFCPECGVRIYQIPQYIKDVLVLKPGTLDDTSWVRPNYFVWMKSGQGWVPVPEGVKALDGQTIDSGDGPPVFATSGNAVAENWVQIAAQSLPGTKRSGRGGRMMYGYRYTIKATQVILSGS